MSWRNLLKSSQKEYKKRWKNFDPDDISKEQLKYLREDVYGGYKQYGKAYNAWGKEVTSRNKGTNYSYYENHPGWSAIQSKLKIGQLNKEQEIARMYDYTAGYGYNSNNSSSSSYTPPVYASAPAPVQAKPVAAAVEPVAAPPPPVPVPYNQPKAVGSNEGLKIASSYKSPTKGGTSRFKRKSSSSQSAMNPSMRINNSLTV